MRGKDINNNKRPLLSRKSCSRDRYMRVNQYDNFLILTGN